MVQPEGKIFVLETYCSGPAKKKHEDKRDNCPMGLLKPIDGI